MIIPITTNINTVLYAPRTRKAGRVLTEGLKLRPANNESIKNCKNTSFTLKNCGKAIWGVLSLLILNQVREYDDETGNLSRITQLKKKDGVWVKSEVCNYNSEGYVSSVDEYDDNKISKTTSYQKNSGLLDWTLTYGGKEKDLFIQFYPDGVTKRFIQEIKGDEITAITYFDKSARPEKTDFYKNDEVVRSVRIGGSATIEDFFENGKKTKSIRREFNEKEITYFGKKNKPILKESYYLNELAVKTEYPEKNIVKETHYKTKEFGYLNDAGQINYIKYKNIKTGDEWKTDSFGKRI